MLQVGQEVVLMSFPGRFRIVEVTGKVTGQVLTIENNAGMRKTVLAQSVRLVPPRAS